MRKVVMLYPIQLAFLLLACGRPDPVDQDAVAPNGELVGDLVAEGLATPANAATAEAVQQSAVPPATGGLVWTYRQQDRAALFGPPGSPAFSIQCQKPREGERQLIFIRHLPPTRAGNATLSFTGNGQAASLPISAVINPGGVGGEWRAMVPPDEHARDVAEAFAGPGAVEVSVSGTAPLVVPSSPEPRRAFADCLAG
jgi:hypothetical protein